LKNCENRQFAGGSAPRTPLAFDILFDNSWIYANSLKPNTPIHNENESQE